MIAARAIRRTFVLFLSLLAAVPAAAQQTGAMSGKVTDTSGGVLPGVTVEARSDVLPSPRVTVTEASGEYRLPALPPGNYTVTFTLSGMQTVTRQAQVQLGQDTVVDARSASRRVSETRNVTATVSLHRARFGVAQERRVERADHVAAGRAGISRSAQADSRRAVLAGRGRAGRAPAAAARTTSTTSTASTSRCRCSARSPPSPRRTTSRRSPPIRGGARAVDFDRSGGFTIDSVSKSGTNRFTGELSLAGA